MKTVRYGLLALVCTLAVVGQNSGDPEFAAQAPRTCGSRKMPPSGAPTVAQAQQYLTCEMEGYVRTFSQRKVDLVGNVQVEIGKARPFNINTDSWPDVDPSQKIYPIRGGYTQWSCYAPKPSSPPDSFPVPTMGKNCMKYEAKGATGQCYKDSFGDWHCKLCCAGQAITEGKWMVSYFPPPPANR